MTKIHSRYDVPASDGITFNEPTLTQQQFKDEVNINNIVNRAMQTGDVSVFTPTQRAEFIDNSVYEDYQSALDTLQTVEDDFYSLPAVVRKEFDNDPDKYVAFISDPDSYDRAVELGLLQGSGDEQTHASVKEPEQPPAGSPKANVEVGDA